jgi:hypothetical protein
LYRQNPEVVARSHTEAQNKELKNGTSRIMQVPAQGNEKAGEPHTGSISTHSRGLGDPQPYYIVGVPVQLMLLATPVMTLVSETARNAPTEYVNAIAYVVVPRKTSDASVPLMAKDEDEKAAAVTPAVPPRTTHTARVRRGTVRFEGVKVLRTKSTQHTSSDRPVLVCEESPSTTHKEHDPDVEVPFASELRAIRGEKISRPTHGKSGHSLKR